MTPPAVTVTTATRARPRRHRQSVAVLASRTGTLRRQATDPSAEFADVVAASIDGPVLRYSQRLVLLKDAERRGIGRFEANLIIAAVLHREGMGQEYELLPIGNRMGWLAPVLTFVGLQSAILVGAWWVLR
jgi:hypothetical protein